ncbi:hypothetical protein J2810_004283 [Chryseobacterium rhizosphaerae]|uniref:hypothetical protein n=1 Tax=Chryseobacterium rhizosphaerae TaxID=395937 RepID=UPI00285D0D77|nr:hypothetical protein [Chryseobacterium rhizosphaerae]MDR6548196.1 hypothetical protein [Chryseobacterium rhizosphaerae]
MSFVTPEGARKAQLSVTEREPVAHAVLSGAENISKYNTGVCHDVVAYALYMRGARISPTQLAKNGSLYSDIRTEKSGMAMPPFRQEKQLVSTDLSTKPGFIQPSLQETVTKSDL